MNVKNIHSGAGSIAAPGRESPMVYDEVGLEPIRSLATNEELAASPIPDEDSWPAIDSDRLLDERMRKIIRALDR